MSRIVVDASRGPSVLDVREVWRYRLLLYSLAWRDVTVRYKQTLLGAAWAVLQPFLTMVVFAAIFGQLIRVPSDGAPYPVFAYAALLPWTLFAQALTRAGGSLVHDASLISKVYFPRLIVPVAAVLAILVDFGIAFVVLLGMLLFYGIVPGPAVLTLPVFLLLAILTSLAVGFWLSALSVRYRDVAYVIPFLTQFWLFITPVAYPSSLVPEHWQIVYGMNPMVSVVEGFRWALLGTVGPPTGAFAVSTIAVLVLFGSGLLYFQRTEAEFADVV